LPAGGIEPLSRSPSETQALEGSFMSMSKVRAIVITLAVAAGVVAATAAPAAALLSPNHCPPPR
jgi:hypothetical protein